LDNIGWLLFDKLLKLCLGLFVVILLARYLQPEQFGQLNYAIAFVGLFTAIATLGLNGIVVRDIIQTPNSSHVTLGTAFIMQLIGGVVAVAIIFGCITLLRPDDAEIKVIAVILSIGLIFKSSEIFKYWFESQLESRYTVIAECIVLVFVSVVKILMILYEAPLIAFVWAILVESALVMLAMIYFYIKRGGLIASWSISFNRAIDLLSDSWPLIFAGLAFVLYMRVDQIMIGQMLGDKEVGIYSAAIRISEVWYFVATSIIISVFPSIIEAKGIGNNVYSRRLQDIYNILAVLALCFAILVTFLSDIIISLLFGPNYSAAGPVLAIHVWSGLFIFLGHASNKRLVVENLQKIVLYRTVLGATINIFANWLLIPRFGIVGAAYASLISYFVALFSVILFAKTKGDAVMLLKAASLGILYSAFRKERNNLS
jgi:PST family polysaccharide transporter